MLPTPYLPEISFPDQRPNSLHKGINDKLCLYFGADSIYYCYWIGFYSSDGNIKGEIKNKLQEFLDYVAPESHFEIASDWGEPGKWLVKQFFVIEFFSEYKKNLSDTEDYLIEKLRLLEDKVKAEESFKE